MRSIRTILTSLFLFTLLTAVAHLSCSDSDSLLSSSLYDPREVPRVNGIWITDESANVLGSWGNPLSDYVTPPVESTVAWKVIPSFFGLGLIYPNPSNGSFTLTLAIPVAGEVHVTMVPAVGPGEEIDISASSMGVTLPRLNKPVIDFYRDSEAGFIQIAVDRIKGAENALPSGFYRIYCQLAGSYRDSTDIYIAHQCSNLQPGMPATGNECN